MWKLRKLDRAMNEVNAQLKQSTADVVIASGRTRQYRGLSDGSNKGQRCPVNQRECTSEDLNGGPSGQLGYNKVPICT